MKPDPSTANQWIPFYAALAGAAFTLITGLVVACATSLFASAKEDKTFKRQKQKEEIEMLRKMYLEAVADFMRGQIEMAQGKRSTPNPAIGMALFLSAPSNIAERFNNLGHMAADAGKPDLNLHKNGLQDDVMEEFNGLVGQMRTHLAQLERQRI